MEEFNDTPDEFVEPNVPSVSNLGNKKQVPLRYIGEGPDVYALMFNIASAAILYLFTNLGLRALTDKTVIIVWLPLALVWVVTVLLFKRLWTTANAFEVKIYLDRITPRWLTVYTKGFHFTTWSSKMQGELINTQNHNSTRDDDENDGVDDYEFPDKNGLVIIASVLTQFRMVDGPSALGNGLRFGKDEPRLRIRAIVGQRLSEMGGVNSYETLLAHKPKATTWVANIFDGVAKSEFEKETGTDILDPVMKTFRLTAESQAIFEARAKTRALAETMKRVLQANPGMDPKDVGVTARVVNGDSEERIITVHNLPPGVTTVALGSDAAVAVGGGRKGR